MKKIFLISLCISAVTRLQAQCIQNCSGYSLSTITYSQFPPNGVNISTSFSPNNDDGYTTQIPLGFNFNYYCNTYSTVAVCSNGFILFGTPPIIAYADPAQTFPDPTTPNNIVALNMNDLDVTAGGSISYTIIGTSPNQQFIVTFSNVPIWNTNGSVINTGQIVLYETSNIIEVHTTTIGLGPNPGTEGIENATGTNGVAVAGRNNTYWSSGLSAYQWSKTLIGTSPTGITGNSVLCAGNPGIYTALGANGASSFSWTIPGGWTGSSTTSVLSATVNGSSNLSVTASYSGCPASTPAVLAVTVYPAPQITVNSPGICMGNSAVLFPSGASTYTITGNTYTVSPATTTSYSVTGTSIYGCASANTAVATVTVFPLPVVSVNSPSICSGNAAVIIPGGANTYTITGGAFTVNPNSTTSYSVTGTSTDGCLSSNTAVAYVQVFPTPVIGINSGTICPGNVFTFIPTGVATFTSSSGSATVSPTSPSSYIVVGTSSDGCVASNSAVSNVYLYTLPGVAAWATKTIFCAGESVTLNAIGAIQYTWSNGVTAPTAAVHPTATTTYTLKGKDANGCSNNASILLVVSPCTGIQNMLADNGIRIFPNPGEGIFYIENENIIEWLVVRNSLGQTIFSRSIAASGTVSIDLSPQPPGIYFVTIKTDSGTFNKRIVKD